MARLNKKTVAEILDMAHAILDELTTDPENGAKIQLSITSGNSKIGKTLNVSTMPGLTCRNCAECIYTCYAMRSAAFHRETCINAWTKNAALLALNRDEYFHQIDVKMNRRKKNKFFRWHVAGDIPDYDYFCRMVANAWNHPDFVIWTYTKDYWFVNKYCRENGGRNSIPSNFNIMFSAWPDCRMNNPYNFPVFNFVPKDAKEYPDLPFCPGNCDICKEKHIGCVAGQSSNVREH